MIPLYDHQKRIIGDNPLWTGIFHGTGGAKTRTALELAEGSTLVIVPKQQRLDQTWEQNRSRFGITTDITVVSKEDFRRDWQSYPSYVTIIVDEAHTFFGVTPDTRQERGILIPKTSQLFDALRSFTKKYPPKRFYLCTATPVSKPMQLWAIGTLLGKEWDFFRFREKYYLQRKMGFRTIWLPKNTIALKEKLVEVIKGLGYTGKLADWFDVPEQTHKSVYFELTDHQHEMMREVKSEEADPMALRSKMRTIENGCIYNMGVVSVNKDIDRMVRKQTIIESNKIPYILERAEEFPKMLIFANYLAQVEAICRALAKEGYKVLALTGSTPNRNKVVSTAEESDACIVVAQCGISSGYELKSFNCVIFASKSYKFLDYEQGLGRVLRADALKKNLYIHLVVRDGMDEACHDTIMEGKDFQEKIMS
jgi:SNF2 family DNA or RNA helicase